MGLAPKRLCTLKVPGRRTGRVISFPVVVADHDGERYLVAMLGEKANWPRNVRATGGRAVLRHGRREAIHLDEVDAVDRPPILRRYLSVAAGARSHIAVDMNASNEEFASIAPEIPVSASRLGAQPTSNDAESAGCPLRAAPPIRSSAQNVGAKIGSGRSMAAGTRRPRSGRVRDRPGRSHRRGCEGRCRPGSAGRRPHGAVRQDRDVDRRHAAGHGRHRRPRPGRGHNPGAGGVGRAGLAPLASAIVDDAVDRGLDLVVPRAVAERRGVGGGTTPR